jgi:hypothetical protein
MDNYETSQYLVNKTCAIEVLLLLFYSGTCTYKELREDLYLGDDCTGVLPSLVTDLLEIGLVAVIHQHIILNKKGCLLIETMMNSYR